MHQASKRAARPAHLGTFVDRLQAGGRYTFDRAEAGKALGISDTALESSLRRLVAKDRIARVRRGFYVVVPLEHSAAGAPPASWFIDDLMRRHLKAPYYVGLLSAAALHGAAHQAPQQFQVLSTKPFRPALVGRAKLRFFTKRNLENTAVTEMNTPTGHMRVSSPEATAFDLVRYAHGAGGLNNVATVLAELAERIEPTRLTEAATREAEVSNIQRLGFLLEKVGQKQLAAVLESSLKKRAPGLTRLRPDRPAKGSRARRWNLVINEQIEADET
jgi:predicted transcriptional regulator of viral defense system